MKSTGTATWSRKRTALRLLTVAATAVATTILPTLAPAQAAPAPRAASASAAAQLLSVTPPLLQAAAPVGRLTPRGCTEGTGSATCDLFAMGGTTSILGTSVPIWGFSTTGAAASATAPGPVLVVNQGDTVSITLHNALAGEQVSLALPGQAAVAVNGSAGDDLSGVATGGTSTYSFVAGRPGSFLYEAGHTAHGARQVAMGLAGALIVLPADGSAYGTTSGFPATAYQDDAVLVLSEIDPALNANPTGFDMRNFAPKYRMFNGKPYPASDPISTDQGHVVLLRYVNVGSQTHAMSVLGGDQVEIAQDGHQSKFQTTVAAESVDPGMTLDTLVTMPTGPEAKLAVYEPAMHLDNDGQHTNDPMQFAFGGMLTFLDTAAPPPSSDGVGPVSGHITLSPNPSNALSNVTVTADLSDATTGSGLVTQAEFVVDDAITTGAGYGVPMTGTFGTTTVVGATGSIPAIAAGPCVPLTGAPPVALNCLSAGRHMVFVRALDSAGNWGVVGSAILNLPKSGPQTTNGSLTNSPANGTVDVAISATGDDSAAGGTIKAAEYFIDTVGADGTGLPVATNRDSTVVSLDAAIPAATVAALTAGTHHVLVHSKDSLGLWGPPLDLPLFVDLTGPGVDAASVAPSPTNGIVTNKSNPGYLYLSAQISDRDSGGALASNLVDVEAFLDPKVAVPVGGTGLQLIAVDGSINSPTEQVYGLLPISQIKSLSEGMHHVYVRGEDAAGNWGAMFGVNLVVDRTAPVLGTLTGSPNPTNGAANLTLSAPVTEAVGLNTAEFWLGTTDPGVGKGTQVPVAVVGGNAVATISLAGIALGTQQFNLRVQDTAQNWGKAVNTAVTVSKPNVIFANNFETTDTAWSLVTGNIGPATAAAMPTPAEPGSLRGLQVTMAGKLLNQPSYLTDNSPTAETSYHARFVFNRNTLVAGVQSGNPRTLTVFQGLTATNGSVFTVEFGLNAGTPALRTVMVRSAGGNLTGLWVNLPTGSTTVQVDWAAGPATGVTAGTLLLRFNGTIRTMTTGNTSAMRMETALLGITAGFTTTNAGTTLGTAYFDSFLSTRFTLP
ncbi:FtsP/CotA-like multicopper oxidase with cupredoxin domain [Nakamurella sp. UYEF19]|uniref:multicopper oxidase domain-containing protein n=1 Tax=Nakamurella sp. UYEF19 TaxID=1756392 RepID=UPI003391E3DF